MTTELKNTLTHPDVIELIDDLQIDKAIQLIKQQVPNLQKEDLYQLFEIFELVEIFGGGMALFLIEKYLEEYMYIKYDGSTFVEAHQKDFKNGSSYIIWKYKVPYGNLGDKVYLFQEQIEKLFNEKLPTCKIKEFTRRWQNYGSIDGFGGAYFFLKLTFQR